MTKNLNKSLFLQNVVVDAYLARWKVESSFFTGDDPDSRVFNILLSN